MSKRPVGEILIEMGTINEEQLEQALEYQKEHSCRLGKALCEMGFANKNDLFKALTIQYNYPYIDVAHVEIAEETISLIPKELAHKYGVIPVEYHEENDVLRVALAPPFELPTIKSLQQDLGKTIEFALSTPEQVSQCLGHYFPLEG